MISLNKENDSPEPQELGLLAEFRTPNDLLTAAKSMRDAGYVELDAHSPFPIHGMDDALQIRKSILPWLVLVAGFVGGVSALAFQWWTNTIDYPYLISGKPMFSLPANIPVTFEVIILLAAFAAFFGMLMLNGLPKLHHPLLQNERFLRATNNGFFLFVDARDERFSDRTAAEVLNRTPAFHVEQLEHDPTPAAIPRGIILTGVVLASLATLPPLIIAKARATTSDKPRLHNFFDMDFQPKFKAQAASPLFTDGRSMRPRIVGTIPRGSLVTDERVTYGFDVKEDPIALTRLEPGAETGSAPNYVPDIPLEVTDQFMRRGRTQFNIHCAVCHGKAGYGNGLASQRALELEQGTWVPPTDLHSGYLAEQSDGQIFNSISNGVRKMPAYGHQIIPEDRWAIVAYVRALQRSQNATLDDVPEDYRNILREFN